MDFAKDRVYLPQDDMQRFGVSDETIASGIATPEFRALLRYEVDYRAPSFRRRAAADRHGATAIWPSISTSSAAAASRFCAPSSAAITTC